MLRTRMPARSRIMSKILTRFIALVLVTSLVIDSAWASVSFPDVSTQSHSYCFTSQALSNLSLAFSKLRMGKKAGSDRVTFIRVSFQQKERPAPSAMSGIVAPRVGSTEGHVNEVILDAYAKLTTGKMP